MFSGIIEAEEPVLSASVIGDNVRLVVRRPAIFDDIKNGDSIAVNGVCLTVENFSKDEMQFSLGAETLRVTHWTPESLAHGTLNLERSLRFGDRIHGHFVSGHVETTATVLEIQTSTSWEIEFSIDNLDRRLVWNKGSIAIQGVSLTVNSVIDHRIRVCLIPETLHRTNLKNLKPRDKVNIEYDSWAKAFANFQEQREAQS